MSKKAKVVIENCRGRHSQGGPQSADMILRAGAKGTGKKLATANYWPWSPKSVNAAEEYIFAAAKRQGYEISAEID